MSVLTILDADGVTVGHVPATDQQPPDVAVLDVLKHSQWPSGRYTAFGGDVVDLVVDFYRDAGDVLRITLGGEPVARAPYPVSDEERDPIEAAVRLLVDAGASAGNYAVHLDGVERAWPLVVLEHDLRRPWLRCGDVGCDERDPWEATLVRREVVRAAARRDGRCSGGDAVALLTALDRWRTQIAHELDRGQVLNGVRPERGEGWPLEDVVAPIATVAARAAELHASGHIAMRAVQALVVDDSPTRWSSIIGEELRRAQRITVGGEQASAHHGLARFALTGVINVLREVAGSVDALEVLARLTGHSFGRLDLERGSS